MGRTRLGLGMGRLGLGTRLRLGLARLGMGIRLGVAVLGNFLGLPWVGLGSLLV